MRGRSMMIDCGWHILQTASHPEVQPTNAGKALPKVQRTTYTTRKPAIMFNIPKRHMSMQQRVENAIALEQKKKAAVIDTVEDTLVAPESSMKHVADGLGTDGNSARTRDSSSGGNVGAVATRPKRTQDHVENEGSAGAGEDAGNEASDPSNISPGIIDASKHGVVAGDPPEQQHAELFNGWQDRRYRRLLMAKHKTKEEKKRRAAETSQLPVEVLQDWISFVTALNAISAPTSDATREAKIADKLLDGQAVPPNKEVAISKKDGPEGQKTQALSNELWSIVLDELYIIETLPGSTFNVPNNFWKYRLVSRAFDRDIVALGFRHLELHDRPEYWSISAIMVPMVTIDTSLGETLKLRLSHVREITIHEIKNRWTLADALKIIFACKNLRRLNWVCSWPSNSWSGSCALPNGLLEFLQQSPNTLLNVRRAKTQPYFFDKDDNLLNSLPVASVESLELAAGFGFMGNKLWDILVSATKLQRLLLIPHSDYARTHCFNGTLPGKLPPLKDLYLEDYDWSPSSNTLPTSQLWDFSQLQQLTMDGIDVKVFLHAVAGMSFPQLTNMMLRDISTKPGNFVAMRDALVVFLTPLLGFRELELIYTGSGLFHELRGLVHDSVESSRRFNQHPGLRRLGRFYAQRGGNGVMDIIDALRVLGA